LQIGTNHLGHFALTNLLLPYLTDRVVVLTSNLHTRGQIHLDDLNSERRPYQAMQAYCDSKLANLLFALELNRRFAVAGDGRRAVSAHPGVTRTNLVSHIGGVQGVVTGLFIRLLNQSIEQGALPTLYAAVEDLPGGSLIGPDGFAHLRGFPEIGTPSKTAQDADLAARLWTVSAELTGTDAVPS
jgi:NAD(P)-dependent dehydrogenase (short-subunit alcohol dehydrogenase family)